MDCLRSLYFQELESREVNIDHAADNTCGWLLRHDHFRKWLGAQKSLLWIKGKPGSGKSTLMKHTLRNIDKCLPSNSKDTLQFSFFFHARGSELQRTRIGLFRSLLYQILDTIPSSVPALVETFQKRSKASGSQIRWELGELQDFLASALQNALQQYNIQIFVDALDECGESEAVRLAEDFHRLLENAPNSGMTLGICFSCRHYPIVDVLAGITICVEDENFRDIESYTHNRLCLLGINESPFAQILVEKASGVFQWVSLVIDQIIRLKRQRGGTQKEVEAKIKEVPSDLQVRPVRAFFPCSSRYI